MNCYERVDKDPNRKLEKKKMVMKTLRFKFSPSLTDQLNKVMLMALVDQSEANK